MEAPESTMRERKTGNVNIADRDVLMSGKPLHRFVSKEPRSLGIVILIFGCAEFLMGFHLRTEQLMNSSTIYIPFWQGFLFILNGSMSIYTELRPSKKMVTVCLSMYVVSLVGIIVSVTFRIVNLHVYDSHYRYSVSKEETHRLNQILGVELLLIVSSFCVSLLLIFLCAVARLALRSSRTQLIVQHIVAPQSDTTSD